MKIYRTELIWWLLCFLIQVVSAVACGGKKSREGRQGGGGGGGGGRGGRKGKNQPVSTRGQPCRPPRCPGGCKPTYW